MAWRDTLRPATFRGVPFKVESSDEDLGRRVEILRFPGRRDVVGQDLGEDARSFSVSAYLIGPDYHTERDALRAALLTAGPGTLVHPTIGELSVIVHDRIRIHESRKEGGYCTVTFQCVESQPQVPQFAATNATEAVKAAADVATAAAKADTAKDLVYAGLPSSAVVSQVTLLAEASAALTAARTTMAAIVSNVASVVTVENQLVNSAEALLAAPDDLSDALQGAFFDMLEDAASLVTSTTRIGTVDFDVSGLALRRRVTRTVRQVMRTIMAGTSATTVDTSSAIAEQETNNLRAIDAVFRASALSAYAHAAASIPWSSYQEAVAAKEEALVWFDDVEPSVSDATYQALRDLRVAMSLQLDTVARSLPYMRDYSPPAEMSALLIAHELYGDARRESEIVARNNLPDPSRVLPYEVLEVASA